jgi:hypothetical protein
MRTSGRCPISCARAGAAVPGPGGPRSGVYRTRDRAPSVRAPGLRRIAVRRRAPCAASRQVRPHTSRPGCPRSAGMTAMPTLSPCSRSCLPGWPVSGRTRAARRWQPGLGPAMPEHNLVRSHCSPVFPLLCRKLYPLRSLPLICTEERQADLIQAGTGCLPPAGPPGDGSRPRLRDLQPLRRTALETARCRWARTGYRTCANPTEPARHLPAASLDLLAGLAGRALAGLSMPLPTAVRPHRRAHDLYEVFSRKLSSCRSSLQNRTVDLLLTIGIRSTSRPGTSAKGQVRSSTSAPLGAV